MKRLTRLFLGALGLHVSLSAYAMTPENPTHFRIQLPNENIYGNLLVTGQYSSLCLSSDTRTRSQFPFSLTYWYSGVLRSEAYDQADPLPGLGLAPCNGSDQKQIFVYDGETIRNKATGGCLAHDDYSIAGRTLWEQPDAGVRLIRSLTSLAVLRPCDGGSKEDWELMSVSGGIKRLYSKSSLPGDCMAGRVVGYGRLTLNAVPGAPVVYTDESHMLYFTGCSTDFANWDIQVVNIPAVPPPPPGGTKKCFWVVTGCQLNHYGGCPGGSISSALPSNCGSSAVCSETNNGLTVNCPISGGTASFQCNMTVLDPAAPPNAGPGVVCP